MDRAAAHDQASGVMMGSQVPTDEGFINHHGQRVVRATDLPGTGAGERVYVMACSHCAAQYGVDGSEIRECRCPECQDGAAGVLF